MARLYTTREKRHHLAPEIVEFVSITSGAHLSNLILRCTANIAMFRVKRHRYAVVREYICHACSILYTTKVAGYAGLDLYHVQPEHHAVSASTS